jgi:N-acetylglucosamine kinase-like BadF-type ATPase
MKLILDGGASSTKLALIDKQNQPLYSKAHGINLNQESEESLSDKIAQWNITPFFAFDEIHAYLAGASIHNQQIFINALKNNKFEYKNIYVESDLLAAARAGLKNESGIVAILGTGSNSAYYNGINLKYQIPPLGFLLGDEASGFAIGREILKQYFRNQLQPELNDSLSQFLLEELQINDFRQFYKQEYPQKTIATVSSWAGLNLHYSEIYEIIRQQFDVFFNDILSDYKTYSSRIAFVGGIAHQFRSVLKEKCEQHHLELLRIVQNPIEELIQFHH